MVNSITKEQGLQITSLSNAGKSPRSIATQLGIPLTAVNQHCSTKGRSPSLTALSNRSVSKTKASPHAIPTKTSDTKYTVIEFKRPRRSLRQCHETEHTRVGTVLTAISRYRASPHKTSRRRDVQS